jgi:hypothetical protein
MMASKSQDKIAATYLRIASRSRIGVASGDIAFNRCWQEQLRQPCSAGTEPP